MTIPFDSADDSLKEYIKALYYQPEPIELSNGEQSDDSFLYALKCDNCQKIVFILFPHYFQVYAPEYTIHLYQCIRSHPMQS